jgi:N-acetylglucosamine kinase-like BadF-type ATPase
VDVVLGIDVGGTGLRGAIAPPFGVPLFRTDRTVALRRGAGGIEGVAPAAAELASSLLASASQTSASQGPESPGLASRVSESQASASRASGSQVSGSRASASADGRGVRVVAVALGCAGAADLGTELRRELPPALWEVCGPATVVVSSDMVTAFLGALGGSPGVTLSAGTGAVALGGDLTGEWRRADGRGDLLGDLGGGAWLGRAGMIAALRASDGRRGGSPRLLGELLSAYADPAALIRELNGRTDRAAVLAAFAPAVLAAARSGDPAAVDIRAEACRHLADTALAARPSRLTGPVPLALTGGLPEHHEDLRDELTGLLEPAFTVRPAAGTPADGALLLAAHAAAGSVPPGLDRLGVRQFAFPGAAY